MSSIGSLAGEGLGRRLSAEPKALIERARSDGDRFSAMLTLRQRLPELV